MIGHWMTPQDAPSPPTRLLLVRHAPVLNPLGLTGRSDPQANCADLAALSWLRVQLLKADSVWTSPAQRTRMTAAALNLVATQVPDLWEQDFGAWEGKPFDSLPDLGPLPLPDLAAHRPPDGESFLDMAARVQAALQHARGTTAIIAHAGTVRAALAMVIGPQALAFAVAPLSLTIMTHSPAGWGIEAVNRVHHGL